MEALATVNKPEPLTGPERRKYSDLDGIVEKGLQTFAEVGAALAIIRDQRLYREDFASFDLYCEARCGWSRQRAAQLIGASAVVVELSTMVDTEGVNERQARALLDVPTEQRATVLTEARKEAKAEGKKVTAERIRDTAHKYTPLSERKPSKPKKAPEHESAAEITAALFKKKSEAPKPSVASEPTSEHVTEADGGVVTPSTVQAPVEARNDSEGVKPQPRASSAEGKVVVFIRALVLPDPTQVDGLTDTDVLAVKRAAQWCKDVLRAHHARTEQVEAA